MMPALNLVELEVSQVENEVKSFQQQEELVYKGPLYTCWVWGNSSSV